MPRKPVIHRRQMQSHEEDWLRVLDAVQNADGTVRLFLGQGSDPSRLAFDEDGPKPAILARSDVLGGAMLDIDPRGSALILRSGITLATSVPELDLAGGRNAAVTFRTEEPPELTADWLTYHAAHHGLEVAVIVLRGGPEADLDGFAAGLETALKKAKGQAPTVILLDATVPLGAPGQVRGAHPAHAPEAPGKDRMTLPTPDPWTAPLGEALIYEIARARFLGSARAVMNLDLSDWLDPVDDSQPNVFDLAEARPEGAIFLAGYRSYPWRVRIDQHPHFADHICRPFDADATNRKWCVAPSRSPEGATWRMIRIGGQGFAPDITRRFWRAMAVRHPEATVSEIVPKTSLVEDEHLIALASDIWDHKPVRAPQSAAPPAPGPSRSDQRRTAIVTTMKNEGPFILEWIAYHRMIGVDDFLIYTNDCTDGTDELLDLLEGKGFVRHKDNPFRKTGLKPQHAALQDADDDPQIAKADWVICMDVDEFINIHAGKGRLDDLFDAIGDANMISFTWRLFGNADVDAFEDRFITEQFTLCAPQVIRKPHQAWGFKTLFENHGLYKKMGVHRPKGLKPDLLDQIRWVNGSGKPMPVQMMRNGWRSTLSTYGYDLVTLNHYALRSAESFLVKRDRGRVNHVDRDQGLNYWFRMNHNAEEDTSIQRMIPAQRAEFDRLMSDPEIAAAHALCVARHRQRIDELKADDAYAAFYAELKGSKLRQLSRKLRHFGSNVFMEGPQVIPDELADRDLPEDFFFTVKRRNAA